MSLSGSEKAWSVQDAGPSINSTMGTTSVVAQKGVVRKVPGRNVFAMDAVFDTQEETKTVYNDMVKPIVLSAANGQHGTVFVYGQTGSGKTFTMQGGDVDPFIGSRPKGIIQMAAADLFERIETSGTRDWVIKASFFEVYNEEVRDLLVPDDNDSLSSICSKSCLPILAVREDSTGHVKVKAHQETIASVQDVARILHKGNAHRASASTARNSRSSRSHAIFRLFVESRAKHYGSDDDSLTVRTSILNLVDLAGSENGGSTTGTRKREGGKINQSLLALTRVIQSLGLPEKKRPKHIGYRDSKLTRILKPSLQGEACVAIICCASARRSDVEETRSTLKFAASAKLIKINPTVNEVSDTAVSKLKDELSTLKEALSALQERLRQQQQMGQPATSTMPPLSLQELPVISEPSPFVVTGTPLASGHFVVDTVGSERAGGSAEGSIEREDASGGESMDGPQPPMREVAVLMESHPTYSSRPTIAVATDTAAALTTNAVADAEAKAKFLQDKLNASYDVVAGLVKDLQHARGMINHVHSQNLNLQERMIALEEEMIERKTEEESPLAPWMYGVGAFLYAFELNQFLLAGILFLVLSRNFVAADVMDLSSEKRKEEDCISNLNV